MEKGVEMTRVAMWMKWSSEVMKNASVFALSHCPAHIRLLNQRDERRKVLDKLATFKPVA